MGKRIPDAARQGIIDKLILIGRIDGGLGSYRSFFERVYPECKSKPMNRTTLAAEIGRHCDDFVGDWGNESGMFANVDVLNWSDDQFLYFCQEYVNPVFKRFKWDDEKEERVDLQPECVNAINYYLKDCGYELTAGKTIGDKTEYHLSEIGGVEGTIHGVVFAAVGKPDLIISDLLNHKIVIPESADDYLYYDRQVDTSGLTWGDLKNWYNSKPYAGEKSFEERLFESVRHCGSPIEEKMFSAYLEIVDEIGDEIPALIPQVYLYYDPITQKNRLQKIFDHQCMDYLMLISESKRIVIELDGVQHYAEDEGVMIEHRKYPVHIASPQRYAAMVSAQRDMTLAGYEVYRFGGSELHDAIASNEKIKAFFCDLFEKYNVVK